MKKMIWGGRFEKGPSVEAIEFNSAENISLDARLARYDILGSLAHVRMLYEAEILSTAEFEGIRNALRALLDQLERGMLRLDPSLEDIHMNIEAAVSSMTPAGKKMHTARSRNDQVLLDMRMYMRDRTLSVLFALSGLQEAFASLSRREGPMVAYTHTRVAQPITVSFWCDAWSRSFDRDIGRLRDAYRRLNVNPLGACAVAGTPWKIDRARTAALLAFDGVQENELDTIASRGECEAEALSALSIAMCKLSRLSEELIWLSQKGLLSIPEEHTTGSSMMPNKKNPDVLELVRGRSGRVYGDLLHCLVSLKGLPPGYNSDMQETKQAAISGFETTEACIRAAGMVVRGVGFSREAIERELDAGFAQATEIADHLAMKGMAFRDAHGKAGKLVLHCEKEGKSIPSLGAEEAGAILGRPMEKDEWAALRSNRRDRLARKVVPWKPAFAEKESERIGKAYSAL
jgi:argininosuccinate lyase